MKRKLLIMVFLLPPLAALPQKVLTLRQCYDLAGSTNAIAGEKDAYRNIWRIRDENLSKTWLPTLDANAAAIYQSDVVDMGSALTSLPIPGLAAAFPTMPNDQYRVTLDINQLIYDGGAVKGARMLEEADLKVNEKQNEADVYRYRSQVNNCYFGILLQDRQRELLGNYLDLIGKRIASARSAAANGIILNTDIDVLASEQIKLTQQINEATIKREALLRVLAELTGSDIDDAVSLALPETGEPAADSITRPEMQVFDLKKEQLDASLGIIKSKRMPKVFGYATIGYGSPPGQNFFEDGFDTYYLLGGGVKWNIFDWNRSKNEKQVINIQKGLLENRKRDLGDNLRRQLEIKDAEIRSLARISESDETLTELRKKITAVAESQYLNGTITATDYMNELNAEKQAVINSEIHRISLALAKVEYLNISGHEIK